MNFDYRTVNCDEPLFTTGQAMEIAGVTMKNLNNWTQREIIDIGDMQRTGRRLYSFFDLFELALVSALVTGIEMTPATAAEVGLWMRHHGFPRAARDASGKLKLPSPRRRTFLLFSYEDRSPHIRFRIGVDWLAQESGLLPHAVAIIPLDNVISHVEHHGFEALKNEHL